MRSPLELRLGHHSLGLHAGKLPSTTLCGQKCLIWGLFNNSISHRSAALETLHLQSFEFKLNWWSVQPQGIHQRAASVDFWRHLAAATLCHIRHELSSDMQRLFLTGRHAGHLFILHRLLVRPSVRGSRRQPRNGLNIHHSRLLFPFLDGSAILLLHGPPQSNKTQIVNCKLNFK